MASVRLPLFLLRLDLTVLSFRETLKTDWKTKMSTNHGQVGKVTFEHEEQVYFDFAIEINLVESRLAGEERKCLLIK